MRKVTSVLIVGAGSYLVTFIDSNGKEQKRSMSQRELDLINKEHSLLLTLESLINIHDVKNVIQQVDSIVDLAEDLGFDRGIDAAAECHDG